MKKFVRGTLATALLLTALSFSSFAQYSNGDFGSAGSGAWTTNNVNWMVWVGSWVPAASGPSCSDNVFILSGHTVTVAFGTIYHCKNLTVEAGAKLWAGQSTLNQETYIAVGDCPGVTADIVCDGMIGNGGVTNDNISFDIDGVSCNISGTGTFDAARMRKEFVVNLTTSLTIDMPINLRDPALTQLYCEGNPTASITFNVTINDYVKLFSGNVSIDGTNGAIVNAFNSGGTFTINDTLEVGGISYFTTNNASGIYVNKWVINGLLKTSEIQSPLSGNARDSIIVNNGGKLEITGTLAFSAFATPEATNLNFYLFKEGSTVEYSALGAQTIKTSSDFGSVGINNAESQYYNLIISGSGAKTFSSIMGVRNDLTITNSAGAAVLAASNNINLGGNWINYNQTGFTEGNLTQLVTFNRNPVAVTNSNQTITCPGGEIFNNVTINKNGNDAIGKYVQLNTDVNVNKQLQFSSTDTSCMVLNGHTLFITNINNAAAPWNGITVSTFANAAGSNNTCRYIISETEVVGGVGSTHANNPSIIKWTMGTAASTTTATCYVFPFGKSTSSRTPIPLTIDKSATGATVDVSVATRAASGGSSNLPWDSTTAVPYVSSMPSLFVGPNPAADSNTVDRWWEIGASPAPLLVDSIQFSYVGSENTLQPTYRNLPIKAQDWTGTGWAKGITTPCAYCYNGVSAAGTIGIAVLRIDTIGAYQPWVLTSVSHPLPIELLYFTAKLKEGKVDVNWATASEINNEIFYVERSKDGQVFEDIGSRPGAGNSTMNIYYSMVDPQPYAGLSYYRLRQKDYDGKVSYSDMVSILNRDKGSAWYVFPNPATDKIKIASSGSEELQNATFGLYSPEGTLVRTISLDAKSQSVVELDIHDLSNGVYFGRISNEYNQQVFKIVKN